MEVTKEIINPWESYPKRWLRRRTPFWTRDLEGIAAERRKDYRCLQRTSDIREGEAHTSLSAELKKEICREKRKIGKQK